MPKHLVKLSKFGGQYRLTIPRAMIEEIEWQDVEYVTLESIMGKGIRIWRFLDGQSLKGEITGDRSGSD